MEEFARYLREKGRAERTVSGYLADLEHFSRWFADTAGKAFAPQLLSAQDLRDYRQYLLTVQHARPATINRRLAALRAYAAWARREGLLSLNPLEGVRGVREQERAPRWLERQERAALVRELEAMVNGARSEAWRRQAIRDKAIVYLLLYAGLRVSELCALEMSDIDLAPRSGQVLVRSGKGGKARAVPLNLDARRAVSDWQNVRGDYPTPFLFLGKGGEKLTPSGVQRRLSEIGARVGVELSPHRLRHTFAKNLVEAGVSLEKVASLLGHDSLDTTRIYLTPSQADLQEAVERLNGGYGLE